MFFSVAVHFVLQLTQNLFKKLVDRQTFVTKPSILDCAKLDRAIKTTTTYKRACKTNLSPQCEPPKTGQHPVGYANLNQFNCFSLPVCKVD